MPAPPVYSDDLAARTAALLRGYTSWDPADGDFGEGLVKVFAHLAGIVADRVNKAPDKNFLAFLQLVGISLRPPSTARVPLTFRLAPGTTGGALVPRRTQAAAPPGPGESEPVIFETEQELFAIAASLAVTACRDPRTDRWTVRGAEDETFAVFEGRMPNVHRLYVSAPDLALPVERRVDLRFAGDSAAPLWLAVLDWQYWTGGEWRSADVTSVAGNVVSFEGLPPVQATAIGGVTAPWLRATLRTSVPRGEGVTAAAPRVVARNGVGADAVATGVVSDPSPRPFVAVASEEAFSKPGARVTLRLALESASFPSVPVEWQYTSAGAWTALPLDDPSPVVLGEGSVSFAVPADWAVGEVAGDERLWLRGMLSGMSAPPPASGGELDYTWDVPSLDGLDVRVDVGRAGVRPELAFADQTPVDLNKDFAPFGAAPQLNNAFYLAAQEAFAPPAKDVTIGVTVTNESPEGTPPRAKPSNDLKLVWEFFDGQAGEWAVLGTWSATPEVPPPPNPFGYLDDTEALSRSGTISFSSPPTLAPVEVNGVLRHWVRVRMARGDYGRPDRYVKVTVNDPEAGGNREELALELSTLAPPWIASPRIDYERAVSDFEAVEHVATENDLDVDVLDEITGELVPFRPFADVQPTLYLGFDQPVPNVETSLYVTVAEPTYTPALLRLAATLEPPVVTWEAWDGDAQRWQPLSPRDETRGFTRPGLVTFIAPETLSASQVLGRDAHWLRARWERGDYLAPAQVGEILTNTTWAANATTRENELLGSSTGQPGQTVRLTGAPVLEGEVIEVRELELPPPDELAKVAAESGDDPVRTVLDESGRPVEIWVRWNAVRDFYDSGPRSRHYVVDRVTGVVAFGDGRRGLIPPQGRANIRAVGYRHGGGLLGNRPSGAITQLKSAVPYVQSISNVVPARGGTAQETLDDVRERGPRELRHGDRAVTAADFEDLAREASTEIARILAIPVGTGDLPGAVGLVVVPRTEDRKPAPSLELLDLVQDAVTQRAAPTFTIWVAGPGWVEVTVDAEVVPVTGADAARVEAEVAAALIAFLHPLRGGPAGTGWQFGRRPHRSDLLTLIEQVRDVDHVRALAIAERVDRPAPAPGASLVYSGTHSIAMVAGD